MTTQRGYDAPISAELAPGVRLYLLRTSRFATTLCRVVLHRDLGPEAAATALLGQVLQSATARHPTREALAHRLADLYGATLHVAATKLGDRQLLTGTLEWPTAHVPRASGLLPAGLRLLREVWSRPKREGSGRGGAASPLDPEIVATEARNLERTLRASADDKHRHALSRCVAETCRGEPHALDAQGRLGDVGAATPTVLAALHERLVRRAPADVFLVGDLRWREAATLVRRNLLWARAERPFRVPPAARVREPRARPRRVVETDDVHQAQLLATWRANVGPRSPLAPAARALAGVLGGGSSSRLFQVVRETHGLCYFVEAGWQTAKGYLLVHAGVDPGDAARARRTIGRLVAEVASGRLHPAAWQAFREAAASEVAAIHDDRAALLGWHQACATLGLDPRPAAWLRDLDAVTPAAVRRLGRRLGPELTFVLVPRRDGRGRGGA